MDLMLIAKKVFIGSVVVGLSCVFVVSNAVAAGEEITGVLPKDDSRQGSRISSLRQSISDSPNETMLDILMRLRTLERQLSIMKRTALNSRTVNNSIKDAKLIASDAWTLAVEARSIAVRAEAKAEQAQKNKLK